MELFSIALVAKDLVEAIILAAIAADGGAELTKEVIVSIEMRTPRTTSSSKEDKDTQDSGRVIVVFKTPAICRRAVEAMRAYGQIPYARTVGSTIAPRAHPKLAAIDCVGWVSGRRKKCSLYHLSLSSLDYVLPQIWSLIYYYSRATPCCTHVRYTQLTPPSSSFFSFLFFTTPPFISLYLPSLSFPSVQNKRVST